MDKWKGLRSGLWANTEPTVSLIGLTVPGAGDDDSFALSGGSFVESWEIERQVARAASVSTGVDVKDVDKLNRNLIKLGHHVPLEFVTYQFLITGISKACSAQISRHRMASIVSASRRYKDQGAAFVYPSLENVDDEAIATNIYMKLSEAYKDAYHDYLGLRNMGAKKGDCRYVIPVASATSKAWSINARSLRNFLKLRLHPTAEAEIRRLATMIHGIVSKITPTLFEDIDCD